MTPGLRLEAIARAVFDEPALSHAVLPAIADFQQEFAAAGASRRRRWLACWRGYVAFWSLVFISPVAFGHWRGRPVALKQRSHRLLAVVGVLGAMVIWSANGFQYFLSGMMWALESLPGNAAGAMGAWGSAAFLAGPLAVAFLMRRSDGSAWGQDVLLAPAMLLGLLSVTVAALLGSAAAIGAFTDVGRSGSAGLGRVLPGVMMAITPMQIALPATAIVLLAIVVAGVWRARDRRPEADSRPRMSGSQAMGLSLVIVVALLAVDRLLRQHLDVMDALQMLLSPMDPRGAKVGGMEAAMRSEAIPVLLGSATIITICLLTFSIGLWRTTRRYAPTALFTLVSRAAVGIALAGSVWHTAAFFTSPAVNDLKQFDRLFESRRAAQE